MVHKTLCVGLNYPNNPWPSLFGCVNDALRWAHLFDKKLSFETRVLIDQTPNGEVSTNGAQIPTYANISAQLRWLCTAAPGDVLVFMFAGYGTQRVWGDRCENALVCGDLNLTLLGDGELSHIFKSLPAGVMLTVIADCTYGTHILDLPCLITDEKQATQIMDQPILAPPMHLKSEAWEKNRHARAHPRCLTPVTEEFGPSLRLHPGVTAFCFAAARTDEVALDANVKGHQSGIMSFSMLQALQKFNYQCTYEQLLGAANATIRDIQDKYMPALDQTLCLTFSVDTHPSEAVFLDGQFAFLSAERRKLKSEEKRQRNDLSAESASSWARPSHEERLPTLMEQIPYHASEGIQTAKHEHNLSARHRSNDNDFAKGARSHEPMSQSTVNQNARMDHAGSSRGMFRDALASETSLPDVAHNTMNTSLGNRRREKITSATASHDSPYRDAACCGGSSFPQAPQPCNTISASRGREMMASMTSIGTDTIGHSEFAEIQQHPLRNSPQDYGESDAVRVQRRQYRDHRDACTPYDAFDQHSAIEESLHSERQSCSKSNASECEVPMLFGLPNLFGNNAISTPALVTLPQVRPVDGTPRIAPFVPQFGTTSRSAPWIVGIQPPQAPDEQTPRAAQQQEHGVRVVGAPRARQPTPVPSLTRTPTVPFFHTRNGTTSQQALMLPRTPSTQSLSLSSGRDTPYMTAPPGRIPTPQRRQAINNCESLTLK